MANALDQQINNLRTLQASYDQIAGSAEAYNTGKVELAANITHKGVDASPTETLPELAQKVNAIPQETYEINGGEMYAKQLFGSLTTPNYWNLYEVLMQLLSDGRLVEYGGILLAEYYKGYDSLALSGAGAGGAYVVSDLDANGQFIMYTADTTHVWDDSINGKGNRFVAYCFADEYHDFSISDANTCPRSIFIGRKVGTITSLVNGRISQIVIPDGNTLKCFDGSTFTQNWNKKIVLRNIETQTSKLLRGETLDALYFKAGKITLSSTSIIEGCAIQSVIIDADEISGADASLNLLRLGIFNDILIKSPYIQSSNSALIDTPSIGKLLLLTEYFSAGYDTNSIPYVYVGYITNDKTKSVTFTSSRNPSVIEIQDGWLKPLDISHISNNLTAETIALMILDRLGDNSGEGTLTLKLGATALATIQNDATYSAYLTDAVDNKNWSIIA